MKISDLLTESKQLDEGPILDKISAGIGKASKAVGAVAGGVAGAVDAAKKGFAAGRSAVAGAVDQPAPTTAADINAAGPKGTVAAKNLTGAAGAAIAKTAAATAGASPEVAGQTVYAQVKSQINNLDKKGKQRIMALLQKSLTPAAAPAVAPTAPAPTPAAPAPTAAPAVAPNPTAAPAAEPVKAARKKKATAPTQAEIDADRARLMGNFTDSVERHKQKMVAEGLSNGSISIFRK